MNEARFPFHPRVGEQRARRAGAVLPDGRPHVPYIYSEEIILAVNAALATGRPLLLRGAPGCGKSTLARDVAFALGRDYEEEVVTSKTTAADLQWRFDAVRRLGDAADARTSLEGVRHYIQPGVLWRAFVGGEDEAGGAGRDAVVLLDEIDKADPDVPNDLLLPLGEGRIVVTDTTPPTTIACARRVLVMITTNGERDLPPAFLRRCVALTLEDPSAREDLLLDIARAHVERDHAARAAAAAAAAPDAAPPPGPALDPALLRQLVQRVTTLTGQLGGRARRSGTAEILDALKASLALGIAPDDPAWDTLTHVLLHKDAGNPDAPPR